MVSMALLMVAGFGGFKSYQMYNQANSGKTLLLENLEALAESPEDEAARRAVCYAENGAWNAMTTCDASGIESSTCTIKGELTILGVTLKGEYDKGKKYSLPWARYNCTASSGNCCKKIGLYTGDIKLA